MVRGDEDETMAYITNVEMTKCGQPQLPIGDSCVTLLMHGNVEEVYFINMAIHHSYGRGFHLPRNSEGVEILYNTLYDVAGHNILLRGTFTVAFVIKNVLINPKKSWRMHQSDLLPSGIKFDGPMNIIFRNRIGGG